jgi:1,4-alpha-glucan branching enzyme
VSSSARQPLLLLCVSSAFLRQSCADQCSERHKSINQSINQSMTQTETSQLGKLVLFRETNELRKSYPVLRIGWSNVLHEDRQNGIMAFERVFEGHARMVIIVNAGQSSWQTNNYGAWVGGGTFREVFNCQDVKYGGWDGWVHNVGQLSSHDGKLWLNIPGQCTMFFLQCEQ